MPSTGSSEGDVGFELDSLTNIPGKLRGKKRLSSVDQRLISRPNDQQRPFFFDFAVPLYGMHAAERIASAFQGLQKSRSRCKCLYLGLVAWLHWIDRYDRLIEADRGAAPLVAELRDLIRNSAASKMEPLRFRRVCDVYAEYMAFSEDEGITRGGIATRRLLVGALSAVLQEIGPEAGFPKLSGRVLQFPKYVPPWLLPSTPTMAEVTRAGRIDWSNPDQAAALVLAETGQADPPLSITSKLEAIRALNTTRLAALRRALEVELEHAYSRFRFGAELIARTDVPTLEHWYREGDPGCEDGFAQWLARHGANTPERQLSLVLKHLVAISEHGALLPPSGSLSTWVQRSGLLSHFPSVQRRGRTGRAKLTASFRALVSLPIEGWNAALGILLIDTSWNVQPLVDLPVDCFVGGRTANGKQVVASSKVIETFKNRAGHNVRAVLSEFRPTEYLQLDATPLERQKYSGIHVVEMVQEMTSNLRPNPNEGPLLICAYSGKAAAPDESHQITLWQEFLKRPAVMSSPEIAGLPITRRMVRKTCLDIHAARHGNEHGPVQLLAGHASGKTTLSHYMRAPWFQLALMNNIRRFQEILEGAFLADLPEVAAAHGLSVDQLLKSRDLAHETGLGFVCLRPFEGIQPGTERGKRCHRVDRCHLGCAARRFVPNESAMLALLLANRSLRAAEATWIAENPERWERVWMPFLAETEAYIARLRDSSFRTLLRRAGEALEASLASGALGLVEVW